VTLSKFSNKSPIGRQRGFTMLELLMVVAVIAIVSAMAIPNWLQATRTYRLRGDVNRISGLINSSRMRGSSAFARVKVDCSGTTGCGGSSACTVTLINYYVGSTPTTTSTDQTVCLSQNVSFSVPSTTIGVGQQNSSSPTQNLTLYFNTLGIPISSTGSTGGKYAMYLQEATSGAYMAIGIAANGTPTVYSLNSGTWVANQ